MLSSHADISVMKVKKKGATTRSLIFFNIVFDINKRNPKEVSKIVLYDV